MIWYSIGIFFLTAFFFRFLFGGCTTSEGNEGYMEPPVVGGSIPFIGHGPRLGGSMVSFISDCCKKYGKIFVLKLFRYRVLFICDPDLSSPYFNVAEEELGMYSFLHKLNFLQAYSEKHNALENIAEIVKAKVAPRFDQLLPIIEDESNKLVERITTQVKAGISSSSTLYEEVHQYVAQTGSRCFLGIPLSRDVLKRLINLTDVVKNVFVASFILPLWVTKWWYWDTVNKIKDDIASEFIKEIKLYREDPAKDDCMFLRGACDYRDIRTGEELSNEEIAFMIILLFISNFESTEVCLTNTVVDLSCHPKEWGRALKEVEQGRGNLRSLFQSRYLHALVMETARQSQLMFGLGRSPGTKRTLGPYNLGNVDMVVWAAPIIQVYSDQVYNNAETYDPDRFMRCPGRPKESMSSHNITAWGAGTHHCPGKPFALFEVKTALVKILQNLKVEVDEKNVHMDYWKFNLFAEKKPNITIQLRNE